MLIAEHITGPLGMTSTGIGNSPAMTRWGQPASNWNIDALVGAGALRSNADDMLRYLRAMMASGQAQDTP